MASNVSGRLGSLFVGILEILIVAILIAAWIYNEVGFYRGKNSKGIPKSIVQRYSYCAVYLVGFLITSFFLILAAFDVSQIIKKKCII